MIGNSRGLIWGTILANEAGT